ncbi:MAG: MBL fold metallo-hydrolase [Flavobacteriales bacterium]
MKQKMPNNNLRITFLGTGTSQGVPVVASDEPVSYSTDPRDKRLRTSIMIEIGEKIFVVDTGPDFRQQMLRENVKRLDAVLFTHEHKDHVAGLDDVRPFFFIQKDPIDLYAEKRVQDAIKRDFHYAFAEEWYPGVPRFNLHDINGKPVDVKGESITPIRAYHHKMPVYGFRVQDFTYITDANYIPEEEKEKIKGSKILVLNALRKTEHLSHFTLYEAVEVAKEMEVEQAFFTHISQFMGFHEETNKELPSNMALAYDGLKIEL